MSYAEEAEALHAFCKDLEEAHGPGIAAQLRYRTAAYVYGMDLPTDKRAAAFKPPPREVISQQAAAQELEELKAATETAKQNERCTVAGRRKSVAFLANLAYGGATNDETEEEALDHLQVCIARRPQHSSAPVPLHGLIFAHRVATGRSDRSLSRPLVPSGLSALAIHEVEDHRLPPAPARLSAEVVGHRRCAQGHGRLRG